MSLSNPALAAPLAELAAQVWDWATLAALVALFSATLRDEFPTRGPSAWARNVFTVLCVASLVLRLWAWAV